ncbi:DUF4352 domain-containing protein [Streptomyces globisporus]|uniref:hypothetical protein n=1 Tax=Streptomyces globisporus TaxID=1908 RepID=UPI00386FB3C8|nr:DUF4352 domain-containing protein [Streptomyces globisporus]
MKGPGTPPKGPFDELSCQYLRGPRRRLRAPHGHRLRGGHLVRYDVEPRQRRTCGGDDHRPGRRGPPGAEVLGRPAVGEPFKLTIGSSDEARPDEFEITVEDVTCGEPLDPKVLAHTADSMGEPTQNPTPESGKQFCVVAMEVLNVGKSEANWFVDDTVTLNVDDTAYSQSQTDAAYAGEYADYWSDQGESGPSYGLNPGSKGPAHAIFQIPEADEPTTLWFASSDWLEGPTGPEPGYLVQLRDTGRS